MAEKKTEKEMATIYIFGKKYDVPAELTIMNAMEYAGYQLKRGCGCRNGWKTVDGAIEGKRRSRSQRCPRNHDQTASGHDVSDSFQGFEAHRPDRDLGEMRFNQHMHA